MIIDSLSPDGLTPLWKKSQLESALAARRLPDWVGKSYGAFVEIMRRDDFPCFFGTLAEEKETIRYAIAPSLSTPEAFDFILEAVYTYLEEDAGLVEHSTSEETLLLTLVVFFPLEEGEYPLEHYAQQAHSFLNELHKRDRVPWPADIPCDPADPDWRYSLGGRSLFVNVCTPANHERRSRNLGPGLTMAINPMDIFKKVWERWGEEPRRTIHKRVEKYDDLPSHPLFQPWHSQKERKILDINLNVLANSNDRQLRFPFHYYPFEQKQGGCPVHQSSPPSAQASKKSTK